MLKKIYGEHWKILAAIGTLTFFLGAAGSDVYDAAKSYVKERLKNPAELEEAFANETKIGIDLTSLKTPGGIPSQVSGKSPDLVRSFCTKHMYAFITTGEHNLITGRLLISRSPDFKPAIPRLQLQLGPRRFSQIENTTGRLAVFDPTKAYTYIEIANPGDHSAHWVPVFLGYYSVGVDYLSPEKDRSPWEIGASEDSPEGFAAFREAFAPNTFAEGEVFRKKDGSFQFPDWMTLGDLHSRCLE